MAESTVQAPAADAGHDARAAASGSSRRARTTRGVIGVFGFLLIGEAVGRAGIVDQAYLPPSSKVLNALGDLLFGGGGFYPDVGMTLLSWASGLAIAILIAVPAGLILGSLPLVDAAVRIVIEFLRPIPGVALIPLAGLLIAEQATMERWLIAYAAVWPILINTVYAVKEVDPVALDTARSFGLRRFAIALRVALPSMAPFISTGIRVASGIGLIVAVSTELIAGGGSPGIGMLIIQASYDADHSEVVYAGVAVAGILGFITDVLMRSGERRLFRWHFERRGGPA